MDNIQKYLELFKIIQENYNGAEVGKKVVQKLFYFYERFGIKLNLRYGIHYYGPYSSKLDNILHILECEEHLEFNTVGNTHVISMLKTDLKNSILSDEEVSIAIKTIKIFAKNTPMELEALSTMDFIATGMKNNNKSEIIAKFVSIKGSKFDCNYIDKVYTQLCEIKRI